MSTLLNAFGRPLVPSAGVRAPLGATLAPKSVTVAQPAINAPSPAKRVTLATTDVVNVLMTECPNKPDTQAYTLYHCYADGQTVADFISNAAEYGITPAKARAHLSWDLKRGRIALNA